MDENENTQATTPEQVLGAVNELAATVVGRVGEQDQRLDQFEQRLRRATEPKSGYRVPDADGGTDFEEPEQGDLISFIGGQLQSLVEGSGSGSFLVPDDFRPQVWDMLAAASVGLSSGFTIIDTVRAEVHLPRVLADPDADWVNEATEIPATEPDIDEVVAHPRKLAARVEMSNEVIEDSTPSALQVVTNQLIRALALKLDLGFYEGSGTPPQIEGLSNVSGIQVVDQGAAALTDLDVFATAIEALATSNATATAIVMHPAVWGSLMRLKELDTGSNVPLLQSSPGGGGIARSIYGVPVFLSSQIATDEPGTTTSAYVYEAAQVVAVRRSEARIELDRSQLFSKDMSQLRGILRYDLAVPNVEAVARVTGIPVTAST